jgi:hypothetical protein
MPNEPDRRDERKEPPRREEAPRTDRSPEREPYYEGHFGTEEEEGVVREEEAPEERRPHKPHPEDAAGGDREI